MKISINKLVANKISKGEIVFLPRIGILQIKNGELYFNNNHKEVHNNSILDDIKELFNINEDIAYKRYECWRRAITIREDLCDIIRIENVVWIAIDDNDDFYYLQNPRLMK